MELLLILLILAVLFGVSGVVWGIKWLFIIAAILFIASFFGWRRR